MEFVIQDFAGHCLAKGATDNPYQVRNSIIPFLNPTHTLQDPHVIHTPYYKIWCSAELPALLNNTPRIVNDSHQPVAEEPYGVEVTLKQLCKEHDLDPARCRRILRRHYGANHVRYSWRQSEVPLSILIKGK